MITLQEICHYLNELLSVSTFTDFAPNGLQVEGKPLVKSIATAVTASLETLETAASRGVDLLLVHHGVFWNKDSYTVEGVKYQKLRLLIENNMSLLSYHLPLDAHQLFGNNWRAAAEMGWEERQPFLFMNGIPIGVRGRVQPTTREELKEKLESYYGHVAHVAFGGPKVVQTIALVSGGAHRSLPDAVKARVDCFITGSFDEPVWHQAFEEKINFFAMGHAATEKIGPKAIGQQIGEYFNLPWQFIDDQNPF